MGQLSKEESQAIEDWLSQNKPTKYPTGYSSIYDEYGNKRVTLKFRMSTLAKSIRSRVKKNPMLTASEVAIALCVSVDDVVATCKRHNIRLEE